MSDQILALLGLRLILGEQPLERVLRDLPTDSWDSHKHHSGADPSAPPCHTPKTIFSVPLSVYTLTNTHKHTHTCMFSHLSLWEFRLFTLRHLLATAMEGQWFHPLFREAESLLTPHKLHFPVSSFRQLWTLHSLVPSTPEFGRRDGATITP